MSKRSRIAFCLTWVLISGLGFGIASKTLFGDFDLFSRDFFRPSGPIVFLTAPLMVGVFSYMIAPYLASLPQKSAFTTVVNAGLGIPLAALVVVMIEYFIVSLFVGGFVAAAISFLFFPMAIVGIPTVWGPIFGSGILAATVSTLYLRHTKRGHNKAAIATRSRVESIDLSSFDP